jgi:uncharacterized protein YacL
MFLMIIRLVAVLGGVLVGAMAADALPISRYFGTDDRYGLVLLIILGIAIGYVVGGAIGRWLQRTTAWAESRLSQTPGWELLIAVGGLFVGLVLAALVAQPVRAVGEPELRGLITLIVFVVLGMMGLELAIAKKHDFATLIGVGGRASHGDAPPKILDTSVVIDGRITDLVRTGFIEGRLLVPRFVLRELQTVADSDDKLKRNRGRRGLDVLTALQREAGSVVEIYDSEYPEIPDVDAKLVRLASEIGGAVLTNDFNLNKVARLQGVRVLNINDLANALKPVVLPGEEMEVHVIREGKERGQGVSYLDDGTMVVVDGGGSLIGRDVPVIVTSVLQTPAGRMIFAKTGEGQRP